MLTIRLSRTGKKKQPQYRIVLQESHRDPWSPAKEILGHYNPRAEKDGITLKEDRIKHWLEMGAKPSATVHNMLVNAGLIKADKQGSVTISKKRAGKLEEKKAEAEEAAKAAEEAEAAKEAEEAAKAEEAKEETPAEESKAEETPAEEAPAETKEKPAEETSEEAAAEEEKKEEAAE